MALPFSVLIFELCSFLGLKWVDEITNDLIIVRVITTSKKEDLQNRVEQITAEVTGNYSAEGSKKRLQSAFKNRGHQPLDASSQQQRLVSRVRFLLIAAILGSLAYLAFYTDTIDVIFEGFKQG